MTRRSAGVDWLGMALLVVAVGSLQYVLEEGNIKDWWNSRLIVYLSIASAVAACILLWWQLTPRNPHPVVQLRVLKNRQLAVSIFLFIVLGFGLYGGVIIFPLFTQSILGFSPTQTGLAMMPGGIATAIMPWGNPGYTLSCAPFTSFDDNIAEAPIGTIWSSSPCITNVGTSIFLRSPVKSVSENALMQSSALL